MSVFHSITSFLSSGSGPTQFPFSGVGSLLLSDISGFSATTPEVSPLDVIEVMGRILELERRCIGESGGFMPYTGVGEVILAVWRASGSSRSHAELAVETGRKILAELERVQTETGLSLQVRVAVTTGKMTIDSIGGRPQVFGAPFTTAKRLLELLELPVARRSHILCTSETLELISARPPSDSIATVRGCSGQDVQVFEFT
jgi:class 3 adenylate cyclase